MDLRARGRTKPQLHLMLLDSLSVYTVILNAFQLCFRNTQVQDCLGKGPPARSLKRKVRCDPVVCNLSTRGQPLLAAFGFHRDIVMVTQKGRHIIYEQHKTAQKSGGRYPPTLKLCFFQAQHNRGDCSFGIRRINGFYF